jgi:hypothetical protein
MVKKILVPFLLTVICLTSYTQGWRKGEMEVKITVTTPAKLQLLTGLTKNFEPASHDGRVYRAYLIPTELDLLKKSGLNYMITISNLNDHYRNFWDNPLVPSGYYTYEQIIAIADSLAANFPSICKKEIWGTSIGNRQLAALKISDNAGIDENEAEIMFDGGIHGDEVGGSQNVIMFARELCLKYGTDPVITDAVNSREIYLFLMVNPDGRVSMSRYNQNGVDCNRDNGYMWDGEGFSPSAVSQIETKTLRNAILNNQFTCYTNFHSGTEIISYPWSYRAEAPRDFSHIDLLAATYSGNSGYPGGLQYGQGYNVMYAINGSTKDFVYGSLGQVGWSIEISMDKQPPSSQIQYYYNVNRNAMLEIIKQCGWGVEGVVTDSVSGVPVSASVWINAYYPVYTDPVKGDYHKFLAPGNYTMTIRANGYKTKTIPGIAVPALGSVVTNVLLAPDTGWYATKLTSCRIPGNNFGDEGYTPGCIGAPDGIPYAMGRNGWVTLDMGDTLYNGPGNDFTVVQSGTINKSFTITGSQFIDGPYTTIGTGNGTTSFDIPASLGKLRYLYIKDNGSGSASGIGAGFNLDAVRMITPPLKVSFSVSNSMPCTSQGIDFTDLSGGNPVSWNWSFPGGNPATSTLQNPTGIFYPASGNYPVTLTISNGFSSLTKTISNFITVLDSPVTNLGNDTLLCDNQQITLNAGNPGATWLWSTGATTQQITVDSSGTGYGTAEIWVKVSFLNGCTASDTVNITFDECTSIDQSSESRRIVITPNPAKNMVNILIPANYTGKWELISPAGTIVKEGDVTAGHHGNLLLTVADLPTGFYYFRMWQGEGAITAKLIITRP